MADSMLRRALLLGMGALSWSRDRAEAMADDLIRHGQLDSGERDSVVELLMERGRRDEQSLRSYVREQVARAVRAVPVATRDDLRQLEERLRLEMTALRKAGPGGEG